MRCFLALSFLLQLLQASQATCAEQPQWLTSYRKATEMFQTGNAAERKGDRRPFFLITPS
jgi:hypothetical protein